VNQVENNTLLARYQRLAEISRDLASTLDLKVLLNRIVHAAADLSQAEAASILLYDEGKRQLYFQSATNLDEPLMRGLIVPLEGSIAGWIVTHREPLIILDAQNDERHFGDLQKATRFRTESLLGVPLIAKDKIIGVLEALNKRSSQFDLEDQDMLIALSAQAAVAIENARLFQQSDFISEIVHELRTPLSSLNTAAHLLLRQDLPPEQRTRLSSLIQTETSRLADMTTAFLDFARLESGRTQFNAEVFDMCDLLSECASTVIDKVTDQGLTLHLDLPADLPPLRADRDKLKQVILNLLSNAIKYNRPSGSINLSAGIEKDRLVFRVADTGHGIPSKDLAHLFQRFFRARSHESVAAGTGLGLAICKRIVEAHGGEILVHSQEGHGTQFSVFLPSKITS
jgi:signal transduction histidine kinase